MFLFILCWLVTSQAWATEIAGNATVVDGDTIHIGDHKIRLSGFDAPESKQTCQLNAADYSCGQRATEALRQLVTGKITHCHAAEKDRYGRWVANCRIDDVDIGAWMVGNGYAVAYRRYSSKYISDEEYAKSNKLGLWAGDFVMPWDWRRGKRLAQQPASNQECQIKGNITRKGDHIYHTSDSPWYDRTRINEAKGERWFCSEKEAITAGWRPAQH